MKRILSIIILLSFAVLPSHAVLKERTLGRTLAVLHQELKKAFERQTEMMARYEQQSKQQHAQLVDYMQQSEQIALILYSQNADFTFDVAYACQSATDLYRSMTFRTLPYEQIKKRVSSDIARYDSLVYSLQQLPPAIGEAKGAMTSDEQALLKMEDSDSTLYILSATEQKDRAECLRYAVAMKGNLEKFLKAFEKDNQYYSTVKYKVERQNAYAQMKYKDLQQSIFVNGGQSYLAIMRTMPQQIKRIQRDFQQKYMPLGPEGKSEWRGMVVLFSSVFMIAYIFGAIVISTIIVRWVLPRIKPNWCNTLPFRKKRPLIILTIAIFLFAVVVSLLRAFVVRQNLMLMAMDLMISIAWLLEAVFVSLLIRLHGHQIRSGLKVYMPFLVMSFIVIWFRIVLIPNSLVNVIYPLILLAFTIWQGIEMKHHIKRLPVSDRIYCVVSFVAMLVAFFMSWVGFTLMAVQVMVWWTFQLAAIASVTCIYDLMERYEIHVMKRRIKSNYGNAVSDGQIIRKMRRGEFVDQTWMFDFINKALVPVCAVASVFFCVFFAASVFEIRDLCVGWFRYNFVDEDFLRLSMFNLCGVVAAFFVFRYIEYVLRSGYFRFRRGGTNQRAFNATLAQNIIAIVVWGIYVVAVMYMLRVPRSGIEYVFAGLSAGLGFASKDILENFIYGLSLMTGRVRVGDYIECEGITGKVESITYQSTQIITLDGSVMAFLNSQLFTKNFKNLTRNHEYELVRIPFGVAYGSNVDEVRKMIIEGVSSLCGKTEDGRDIVNPKYPLNIAFTNFGDNSVDLVLVVWVLVDQKIGFTSRAMEKIYNVLNEHNIEIPFPQRDVYIRSVAKSEA